MTFRPCPFCGKNEQEYHEHEDEYGDVTVAIRCQYCSAMGERCGTRRQARECWNTRTPEEGWIYVGRDKLAKEAGIIVAEKLEKP